MVNASENKFVFVPFKHSMNVSGDDVNRGFEDFKKIYNKRNPESFKSAGWPMIPKKIHQIWLYSSAIPLESARNARLWREMYPDWEYKLWLLEDINELDFYTKDLYRKARKITEKLDIVKFEILNKFGGVYIDINYVPIQDISFLNNYYKFYAGFKPLSDGHKSSLEVSTAFLASRQKNLFLHKTLLGIRDEWHKQKYYKNFTRDIFNKIVRENIKDYRRSIIFPASYFGVVLVDHPVISFVSKYIFFKKVGFYQKIHAETMAAKQKY